MSPSEAAIQRTQHLLDLGRPEMALDVARATLGESGEHPRLWCLVAVACLNLGRPAPALEAAERAAAFGPPGSVADRIDADRDGATLFATTAGIEAAALATPTVLLLVRLARRSAELRCARCVADRCCSSW